MSIDKLVRETDFGGGYIEEEDLPLPLGDGFPYRDAADVWSFQKTPSTGAGWNYRKSYTKDTGKPYVGASKGSYKTVTIFAFPGTASGANPNRIKAVLASKDGDGDVGIRVVNVSATPPLVIAEKSSLSVLDEKAAEYDLGVVSNLPTAAAIFEIQIKKSTKKCLLYDILMDRS